MRLIYSIVVSFSAALLLAQTAPTPAPAPAATPAAVALPRVAIETTAGRIVVEADTRRAPITAGNFLRYVDQRRLDGITFYRVSKVADHYGFVQFGVNGDPGKMLPPIRHEPTTLTGIAHKDFTLSSPRFKPGSARGEFTIMLGDQPSMDADPTKPGDNLGYAAWGHVVEGQDAVLRIFDAPIDPARTVYGSFRGEVPAAPVKVLTARRIR